MHKLITALIPACLILPVSVAILFAIAPTHAQAQSFNCQDASLPAERTICSNANLSHLDEQTAGMYFLIIGSGSPADTVAQVKSSQAKFLTTRNACQTNINCLVDAYTSEMMHLSNVKSDLGL